MSVDQDYRLYFMYNAQANVLEWVSSGLRQNRLLKPQMGVLTPESPLHSTPL